MRQAPPISSFTASLQQNRQDGSADICTHQLWVRKTVTHFFFIMYISTRESKHLSLSLSRVVLGVCVPALVLSCSGCGFVCVLGSGGLVWMYLLQHTARSVAFRRLHPTGGERLQLRLHRGESHMTTFTQVSWLVNMAQICLSNENVIKTCIWNTSWFWQAFIH